MGQLRQVLQEYAKFLQQTNLSTERRLRISCDGCGSSGASLGHRPGKGFGQTLDLFLAAVGGRVGTKPWHFSRRQRTCRPSQGQVESGQQETVAQIMNWVSILFSALMSGSQQAAMASGPTGPGKKLRNSRIVAWIGVLVTLGGLAAAIWGAFDIAAGLTSSSWEPVPGRISESQTVIIPNAYHESETPIVRYTYRVEGRQYEGKRVTFGRMAPADQIRQFPPGKPVAVYVDPEDPSDAVLIRGMTADDAVFYGLLYSVLLLIGLLTCWMAAHMRRDASAKRQPGDPQPVSCTADLSSEEESYNPYR
jgi:hypothetical protein